MYYYFFWPGKNPWWLKNYKRKLRNLSGSEPYSGRSSSTKPSCSKTELNRCTTKEIRWNKNEDARTSPVVSANHLPNSLKNWRASRLIGPWLLLLLLLAFFFHRTAMIIRLRTWHAKVQRWRRHAGPRLATAEIPAASRTPRTPRRKCPTTWRETRSYRSTPSTAWRKRLRSRRPPVRFPHCCFSLCDPPPTYDVTIAGRTGVNWIGSVGFNVFKIWQLSGLIS